MNLLSVLKKGKKNLLCKVPFSFSTIAGVLHDTFVVSENPDDGRNRNGILRTTDGTQKMKTWRSYVF